jgi:hypothetical protein
VENRWNIKELLVWTTRYFSERGMDNPRLEAELLLAHTLGQDRVQLLFSCNEIPRNYGDKSDGFYRRLLLSVLITRCPSTSATPI